MQDFSTVEDTLFVPMLGRIYASENFPHIFCDKKALELKSKLPGDLKGKDTQTQYTLMASAVRSANMDRYIKNFIRKNENGVIVQLGAGLETTFFRNDNGKNPWFEVDLESVIKYRKELLSESEREKCLAMDAFSEDWIKEVRKIYKDEPILVTASGLFYYFEEKTVIELLRNLAKYGDIEILFDTVSGRGMKRMTKYMKQVGHSDATMYFYVDSAEELAKKLVNCKVLAEEAYYAHTDRKGLNIVTSISMNVSDRYMMVKMEHLKLN